MGSIIPPMKLPIYQESVFTNTARYSQKEEVDSIGPPRSPSTLYDTERRSYLDKKKAKKLVILQKAIN